MSGCQALTQRGALNERAVSTRRRTSILGEPLIQLRIARQLWLQRHDLNCIAGCDAFAHPRFGCLRTCGAAARLITLRLDPGSRHRTTSLLPRARETLA